MGIETVRYRGVLAAFFLVFSASCGPAQTPAVFPTLSAQIAGATAASPAGATRQTMLLDSGWRFATDPDQTGEQDGWADAAFDDATWAAVDIPHTWNVMPAYADYSGLAWYRLAFTGPDAAQVHEELRFAAVFYLAKVWLNGVYLGQHEGGYTPFRFDVTGLATPGAQNLLAVEVDNRRASDRIPANLSPGWSFDWWNYGGITRDVSLEVSNPAYIANQKIIAVPHLTGMDAADTAVITADVSVKNGFAEALTGTLQATLVEDTTGRMVLDQPVTASVRVQPGASGQVRLEAIIHSPLLWHFDHPNLYRWKAVLLDAGGQLLDENEQVIGIRSVELRGGQIIFNGEPVRLAGVDWHADFPGQGSALTATAMAADWNDLKALNEVFTRPVHYPQAEGILDYADRHGVLLIPEVPAWQLTAEQLASPHMQDLEKSQLGEMITSEWNHASIWAWSIGNEFASGSPAGKIFVQEMIAYVKSLDPARPVGFATDKLGRNPAADATAYSDFVLMNEYFGTWHGTRQELGPALDRVHAAFPDKTVIISEFGFAPHWNSTSGRPSSALDPADYFFIPDGTAPDSPAADAIRRDVINEQMPIFRSRPFVAAALFWSYQDYRTPTNFKTGLVTADRMKRASWQVLRDQYAPVLIEEAALPAAKAGRQTATVLVRSRGPVETDMPAYTLRGYTLHWAVTSPDGGTVFAQGDAEMPVLAPGTEWSAGAAFAVPDSDFIFTVTIVRPTGFTVTDRSFDPQGNPLGEG